MANMYADCGFLVEARQVFNEMPERNSVTWNALITSIIRRGELGLAHALFDRLPNQNVVSWTDIIDGYARMNQHEVTLSVFWTMVGKDAYSKCGCMESVVKVFGFMDAKKKNLVSWTSIISGFAMHGMRKQAVHSFKSMENKCLKQNRVTFLSILSACSHGWLVEEGHEFFRKMVNECLVEPKIKHYECLIDMLGKVGRLEDGFADFS
ncbi:hypothetical protein RHSIM_Rhsim03G0142600 [Rhododendron simsii]|uniref:Pentatricopeptide repeat-containing protein n=1 Tax=Rhododendron simsii TaxID=118357 RepID=A0A834H941_RHOSS|nr:hypothetical protein RHSIM_Rhsim03G0142600 [Rhododendron simsii]